MLLCILASDFYWTTWTIPWYPGNRAPVSRVRGMVDNLSNHMSWIASEQEGFDNFTPLTKRRRS